MTVLIKHYRLDHAGIMLVVSHIRDALPSPTQRNKAVKSRKESDHNTEIFGNWKNAIVEQ